jgi:hypothetical protein
VVSPRSASSSWTTLPVPSSVTSRAQVCDSITPVRCSVQDFQNVQEEEELRIIEEKQTTPMSPLNGKPTNHEIAEFWIWKFWTPASHQHPTTKSRTTPLTHLQSRLTTSCACSSPSVRPAVSVKNPHQFTRAMSFVSLRLSHIPLVRFH